MLQQKLTLLICHAILCQSVIILAETNVLFVCRDVFFFVLRNVLGFCGQKLKLHEKCNCLVKNIGFNVL